MNQKIVPDTENHQVAKVAIAWEITERAYSGKTNYNPEEYVQTITNAFIKVYQALLDNEPIGVEAKK